jgi:hypothetical protein
MITTDQYRDNCKSAFRSIAENGLVKIRLSFTEHRYAPARETAALENQNGEICEAWWKPRLQSRKLSQISGASRVSRSALWHNWRRFRAFSQFISAANFLFCRNTSPLSTRLERSTNKGACRIDLSLSFEIKNAPLKRAGHFVFC